MRIAALFLFLIQLTFAVEITYFMNLSLSVSCPGDVLHINATASSGEPAADVELRLVLYSPYQGLRALKHTDEQGLTSVELTKPGEYRVYISTEEYNHPKYVAFSYPSMCPPPPPKAFNISVVPDCNYSLMEITITENGTPVEGVFVRTGEWSSLTGSKGEVSLPFEEGWVFVSANKSGYVYQEVFVDINCTPPGCINDEDCASDQYCWDGNCLNITGDCGYAANHTWFVYECCSDSDCAAGFECLNNSCVLKPPPPPPPNVTNITEENISINETTLPEKEEPEEICVAAMLPLLLLLFRK